MVLVSVFLSLFVGTSLKTYSLRGSPLKKTIYEILCRPEPYLTLRHPLVYPRLKGYLSSVMKVDLPGFFGRSKEPFVNKIVNQPFSYNFMIVRHTGSFTILIMYSHTSDTIFRSTGGLLWDGIGSFGH